MCVWSVRWLLRYVTYAYIPLPRPIFGITGVYWNDFTLKWEVITRGGDATAEVPLACSHADHERVGSRPPVAGPLGALSVWLLPIRRYL